MKKIITFCVLVSLGANVHAQMKDVTVTLQPTASYNWFDQNTAIEDGVMFGARVGFGFGEALELRGVYERSNDLKNTVNGFDVFSDNFVDNFNVRNVDVTRIGGEFKANIPTRGTFVPYFTLGAGVQTLEVNIAALNAPSNEQKSEQVYANIGLGTQIKLGNRLFLNLEAKNTIFNMNPASILYQEGQDQSDIEGWLNDNNNSRMYNWSVLAGLQVYLGGRSPEEFSALDRAYYNKFSGGLGGFKLILEPAGAYIDFDKDTNFRDSYFLGGKIGFDLNQYIGIRGYYYQSTRDEKISFDWDDMGIYGADFIAKLNVSRGLVPYVSLGGGYINVYNETYLGRDGLTGASSGYFAKGGVGLNVPVGRNLELFGDANLLFTSERDNNDLENTISPDELKQHTMFSVGLRFQLGKRADNTDEILRDEIDQRVEDRTQVYQDRIKELESELSDAYKNNDTKKAVAIIEEKKELERENGISQEAKGTSKKTEQESKVEMTPKELEELIEKVIQGVDEESSKPRTINDRMDRLERLLLEINTGNYRENLTPARQEDASQKILDRLNELDRNIEKNTDRIDNLNGNLRNQNQDQDKTVVISSGQQAPIAAPQMAQASETKVVTDADGNTVVETENATNGVATGVVINEGLSVFTGVAIADDVSMIIGIRGNYSFTNSPFKFMPDLYLAPGENTGFGINANVVIPFEVNAGVILNPYIGAGIGYNDAVGESTFSPNLIIGTSFNLLGGKLFADYTAHNFVDIHRISVGYKLNF
ncbi:outer membrane beta-barrel protein [Subsaximicrobium wynnwilliamsii]|uniref:Outer membrane beta-barrel protein n=1 Tax=Subsaximicrobium wynnwilliamsii TaxID=291179 RepID=A0A5C6ZKT9_9FLAO|nr:outer membrane beta-barrel protein [Subsaximicrobium wynnwilliamsii]TXD85599.1 outer membrane beta-barrel protein [Subsaximicrobium wynnwilliamsii]TXD90951.1 outer membrane beta-barrel protein [Subsaximicrobium wynnwilliamsii]TXE05459.1 outer membrane beta-barrel protein [Subsaximicrobium wynnwilliamsii]